MQTASQLLVSYVLRTLLRNLPIGGGYAQGADNSFGKGGSDFEGFAPLG